MNYLLFFTVPYCIVQCIVLSQTQALATAFSCSHYIFLQITYFTLFYSLLPTFPLSFSPLASFIRPFFVSLNPLLSLLFQSFVPYNPSLFPSLPPRVGTILPSSSDIPSWRTRSTFKQRIKIIYQLS